MSSKPSDRLSSLENTVLSLPSLAIIAVNSSDQDSINAIKGSRPSSRGPLCNAQSRFHQQDRSVAFLSSFKSHISRVAVKFAGAQALNRPQLSNQNPDRLVHYETFGKVIVNVQLSPITGSTRAPIASNSSSHFFMHPVR